MSYYYIQSLTKKNDPFKKIKHNVAKIKNSQSLEQKITFCSLSITFFALNSSAQWEDYLLVSSPLNTFEQAVCLSVQYFVA
jgi:hypothetical protein